MEMPVLLHFEIKLVNTSKFQNMPRVKYSSKGDNMIQGKEKEAVGLLSISIKKVKFRIVLVIGGTFIMGATPEQEDDYRTALAQDRHYYSRGFRLAL